MSTVKNNDKIGEDGEEQQNYSRIKRKRHIERDKPALCVKMTEGYDKGI